MNTSTLIDWTEEIPEKMALLAKGYDVLATATFEHCIQTTKAEDDVANRIGELAVGKSVMGILARRYSEATAIIIIQTCIAVVSDDMKRVVFCGLLRAYDSKRKQLGY